MLFDQGFRFFLMLVLLLWDSLCETNGKSPLSYNCFVAAHDCGPSFTDFTEVFKKLLYF